MSKDDAKTLLSQLLASIEAGTVEQDYGTQGARVVIARLYYFLDHEA